MRIMIPRASKRRGSGHLPSDDDRPPGCKAEPPLHVPTISPTPHSNDRSRMKGFPLLGTGAYEIFDSGIRRQRKRYKALVGECVVFLNEHRQSSSLSSTASSYVYVYSFAYFLLT